MATDDASEPEPEPVVIELEAELPTPPVDAAAADTALKAAVRDEAVVVPAATAETAATTATTATTPAAAPSRPAGTSGTSTSTANPGTVAKRRVTPPPKVRTAKTEDDDEEQDEDGKPRRWPIVAGALAVLAGGITAIVLAGRANHRHLYLHCGTEQITALRGRSFPPWGKERIGGAGWKAIAIPPATECTDRGTKDPVELEGWYLDALIEQATLGLTADGGDVGKAAAQLQQALLLARSPDRRDQRKDIDRLLADVTYRGGVAQLKNAIAGLRAAAAQFDDAAGRRPRHAADAAAWAGFARSIALRLEAGPTGEATPSLLAPPPTTRPPAPPGVALPVEPATDGGVLRAPDIDAGVAGIPSGGVLM